MNLPICDNALASGLESSLSSTLPHSNFGDRHLNHRVYLPVLVAFFSCLTLATAKAETKSKTAKLKEGIKNAVNVELGDHIKAKCSFYIVPDHFGSRVVSTQAMLKNTGIKTLHYGYYVAFFDQEKNLVGCTSFSGKIATLAPGKETNIGNVLELPTSEIDRIASYQVTLIEAEKEFGK